MTDIESSFSRLPHVGTWTGISAEAANERIGKLGKYLTEHAAARQAAGKKMNNTADEIDGVKQLLQHVLDEAKNGKFSVDMQTGKITPQSEKYDANTKAYLEDTIKRVMDAGDACNADLVHAVNLMDGSESPDALPGTLGQVLTTLGTNDTYQRDNQIKAFQDAFGRTPVSAADWQDAAMLDPHTYDPKYQGVESKVVAAKIDPQPGKGTVLMNAFIPGQRVWNFGHDLGDNRGFNRNAAPDQSRGNVLVDFENGVVIARQNPSVSQEFHDVAVGTPDVMVNQTKDGGVNIRWQMADGFLPGGTLTGAISQHNVAGNLNILPTPDGIKYGGVVGNFPAYEIYASNEPKPLLQYMPSMGYNEAGPLFQLPLDHTVGELHDVHSPGIPLGSPSNMPRAGYGS